MRHLMHTLEASGNYLEAERSLDAYIAIVENEKKTLSSKHSSNSNHPISEDIVQDVDSDEEILLTMAAGIRLLVKFRNDGKRAMAIAQKMESSAKSWNITDPKVLGTVYHAVGVANSLWSIQSMSCFMF